MTVPGRNGENTHRRGRSASEGSNWTRSRSSNPRLQKTALVTAANSSSIADGAAALVLMRQSTAREHGLAPLAVIRGHATHSQEPAWFTTAPVGAIQKLLAKVGWRASDVDVVGNQRGIRRGGHGRDARAPAFARARERAWRCLRAGSSDRRDGGAGYRDAAGCASATQGEAWGG